MRIVHVTFNNNSHNGLIIYDRGVEGDTRGQNGDSDVRGPDINVLMSNYAHLR